MNNFNYYCNVNGSDKGDIAPDGNHYAGWYENWFAPLKEKVTNICEIGVYNGGSTKAFYDYFPNTQIIGLDIFDKTQYENDRTITKIVDQGSYEQLDNFISECNNQNLQFDIILDDGSHDVIHQQITFGKLFQLVKPGGIYIIEDMCTSYFTLGTTLYGYSQTQAKIDNNTIKFLNTRPFSSIWINPSDIEYINNNVEYVSIFDRLNTTCTYLDQFNCENNYPPRSITSIIKKR
jgi:predicted O-methyltransferase YrrM